MSIGGSREPIALAIQEEHVPPPEIPIRDIEWSAVALLTDFGSQTDLQKDECWEQMKGQRVNWAGRVHSVSNFQGLHILVKVDRRNVNFDAIVRLLESERPRALLLSKGDSVTFTGKLTEYRPKSHVFVDDAELVIWQSPPLPEASEAATANNNQSAHTEPH
jgi:hypothetical protein